MTKQLRRYSKQELADYHKLIMVGNKQLNDLVKDELHIAYKLSEIERNRMLHLCDISTKEVSAQVEVHNWAIKIGLASFQTAPVDAIRRVKTLLNY
jgi:hypothetical protein